MYKFGILASASALALCLCGQSAATAGADPAPIRILCEDDRLTVLCDELARGLADRSAHPVEVSETGTATGPAHLTLRFVADRITGHVLSGRLVWSDSTGRTGIGTEIDLTVMDATLDDEMMRDYARQLLNFTDLPL